MVAYPLPMCLVVWENGGLSPPKAPGGMGEWWPTPSPGPWWSGRMVAHPLPRPHVGWENGGLPLPMPLAGWETGGPIPSQGPWWGGRGELYTLAIGAGL